MRQAAANRKSEMTEGVLDDLCSAALVHHSKVESYLCQLACGNMAQIFRRRRMYTPHLRRAQSRDRRIETARRLDLAEHDHRALAQDQVDLAALAAPAGFHEVRAATLIACRHAAFRRHAGLPGAAPAIGALCAPRRTRICLLNIHACHHDHKSPVASCESCSAR